MAPYAPSIDVLDARYPVTTITGIGDEQLGFSVAAGDIDRDGHIDLLVSALYASKTRWGAVYSIGGSADGLPPSVDFATPGAYGYQVQYLNTGTLLGAKLAFLGDFNADHAGDFVVGARYLDNETFGPRAGFAGVVLGDPARAGDVAFSDILANSGFGIAGHAWKKSDGGQEGDALGSAVAGPGDINGDGIGDLLIGAWRTDVGDGRAYVFFGHAGDFARAPTIDTLNGRNGFTIYQSQHYAEGVSYQLGISAAGAGDVNGDGLGDIVVGANAFVPGEKSEPGNAYVIFGSTDFSASFDLASLNGVNGFRIDGINEGDALGSSVAAAGDVNGDGYDDLLVGAGGYGGSSAAYVVYGRPSGFAPVLHVADLNGANGFAIGVSDPQQHLGNTVAGAGDWNGDGFDDVVVRESNSDICYLVFGRAAGAPPVLQLNEIDGSNGIVITGPPPGSFGPYVIPTEFGLAITSADLNGDRLSDLIIGAPQASADGTDATPGQVFVVYGELPTGAVIRVGSAIGQTIHGGLANDRLAGLAGDDTLMGHAGQDRLAGGTGNDVLVGGRGHDSLSGGTGADRFVFAPRDTGASLGGGADRIVDFRSSEHDRIDLTMIDADETRRGIQVFSFVGKAAFSQTAGELRVEFHDGTTEILGDTNGDGEADLAIALSGRVRVSGTDFVFVAPDTALVQEHGQASADAPSHHIWQAALFEPYDGRFQCDHLV